MLPTRAFACSVIGMFLLLAIVCLLPADAAGDTALPSGAGVESTAAADFALVRSGNGAIPAWGGSIVLPVEALGVQGLGAVTVRVSYDPDFLTATSCQRNTHDFPTGGFCNLLVDRNADGRYDAVYLNELAQDSASAPLDGPLNLAQLTWSLVGSPAPGSSTTLTVSVTAFTNVFGEAIPFVAEDGQVTVSALHTVRLPFVLREP